MPSENYRYYCLDSQGQLHDAAWFAAASDEEAIAQVEAKHRGASARSGRAKGSFPASRLRAFRRSAFRFDPVRLGVQFIRYFLEDDRVSFVASVLR